MPYKPTPARRSMVTTSSDGHGTTAALKPRRLKQPAPAPPHPFASSTTWTNAERRASTSSGSSSGSTAAATACAVSTFAADKAKLRQPNRACVYVNLGQQDSGGGIGGNDVRYDIKTLSIRTSDKKHKNHCVILKFRKNNVVLHKLLLC